MLQATRWDPFLSLGTTLIKTQNTEENVSWIFLQKGRDSKSVPTDGGVPTLKELRVWLPGTEGVDAGEKP